MYEVIATIEHIGDKLEHGHYISYVLINGNWYFCNDTQVISLAKENEAPTRNIYILLLKKLNE